MFGCPGPLSIDMNPSQELLRELTQATWPAIRGWTRRWRPVSDRPGPRLCGEHDQETTRVDPDIGKGGTQHIAHASGGPCVESVPIEIPLQSIRGEPGNRPPDGNEADRRPHVTVQYPSPVHDVGPTS